MNYVREYNDKIQNGEIVACTEVRNVYARMVADMDDPEFPYWFSESAGNHAIIFIETFCRHYQGDHAGELVKLELFQAAFIQALFGWLEKGTNLRRFREYFMEIPRKHGKSFISGCIAAYMLVADGEPGAEIYSCATKLDQAKIIYNVTRNIVEQSEELRALVKPTRDGLNFKMTRSIMKPLPNESKSLDGLNIHLACLDEVHEQRDVNIYGVLRQGMKARKQPIMGSITTSGFYRGGLYDNLHAYACDVANGVAKDDRLLPLIYKLDKVEEWTDPRMWMKANPGLGTIKSYAQLADDVERGKNDQSYLPTLLTKDFDMVQNQTQAWLSYDDAINEDTYDIEDLKHSYAIGGCDLSSVYDLTCATLIVRKPNDDTIYVLQKYFLPQKRIDELEKTKSKEAPYKLWAEQGWLEINEGAQVDYSAVTRWFIQMVEEYDIRPMNGIYYDRALAGYWVGEMENYGFPMVKCAQTAWNWSQPMKELGAKFAEHKVNSNNNPILRWCLLNVAVKSTNSDGVTTIQPVKIQQQRRIDGFVSLLNAYVGYVHEYDEYMAYVR